MINDDTKKEVGIWAGYTEVDRNTKLRYSVEIPIEKFEELWEKLQNWKGSQKEFYFKFVNALKIREVVNTQRGKRRI